MDPKDRAEVNFDNETEHRVWMETIEQTEGNGREALENS
jgi:hypothetical protein